jgi:Protein of unknown function (DUF2971)
MPADTAKKVLESKSLRWSSPVLFNDPFDVPRELTIGIDPSEITDALKHRLAELIRNPPDQTLNLNPTVSLLVERVKNGIPSEVKEEMLHNLSNDKSQYQGVQSAIQDLRNKWSDLIPDFRILCFTESPMHLAMWHHYADRYRGVVLEFRCIDELNSAWLCAEPVKYPKEKPAVYTAAGWAELLMMTLELATRELLHTATYTKTPDWSYENEWRMVTTKRANDSDLSFSDYRFRPEELASIYLGPRTMPPDKDELLKLGLTFPSVNRFEGSIGVSRELNFHHI